MIYRFECDVCQLAFERTGTMSNFPKPFPCPECAEEVRRVFGAQVSVFKPFIDYHIDHMPIEFGSRRARDAYLKANNLTYDTGHWSKPDRSSAVDTITVDEVMKEITSNDPRELKKELVQATDPSEGIGSSADVGSA